MTNIRENLNSLAEAIETLQARPAPKLVINDREISGNKIVGGKIAQFASVGIKDNATYKDQHVLYIENDRVIVPAIETPIIKNSTRVEGDLNVDGQITATRLHVDELTADVRNERTSNLEFKAVNGNIANKGIVWTGQGNTKQLTLQTNPDRLFCSETIELPANKEIKIHGQTALSEYALGKGVKQSSLKTVGVLEKLEIAGPLNVDSYLFYDADNERLGLGTSEPNGTISISNFDHEFVIDSTDDRKFKIGTWTTTGMEIITDDTKRLSIESSGIIRHHSKTVFDHAIGIKANNFSEDVDITTAGPVRFQNKKQEVGSTSPTSGNYVKGDLVWNNNPQPTGYVGWICVREGTPGEWKPFGQIAT